MNIIFSKGENGSDIKFFSIIITCMLFLPKDLLLRQLIYSTIIYSTTANIQYDRVLWKVLFIFWQLKLRQNMDFSNKNQTTKADGTDKNVNVFYFLKTPFKIKLDHLVQKQELT